MKRIKKCVCLALALVLVMGLAVTVNAAGQQWESEDGWTTVVIENGVAVVDRNVFGRFQISNALSVEPFIEEWRDWMRDDEINVFTHPVIFATAPATLTLLQDTDWGQFGGMVFRINIEDRDDWNFTNWDDYRSNADRTQLEITTGNAEPGTWQLYEMVEAGATYVLEPGVYWVNSVSASTQALVVVRGDIPTTVDQPSSWAAWWVNTAIEEGLVPKNLQSQYTQAATRAEFAALAVTLYETVTGREITERATFNDTTDINVQKMGGLGVVTGVGGGNFNPNGTITREQAAVMIARLAVAIGQPLPESVPTFADNAQISSWAVDGVGQVQASGIMGGVGNNRFSPQGNYTREQSIITMVRMFEILS